MAWRSLKNVNLEKIKQARLQLHQASQILAATGISFIEKESDDSHTSMQWIEELNIFESSSFGSHNQLRLAINLEKLKEYAEMLEKFINTTKEILNEK